MREILRCKYSDIVTHTYPSDWLYHTFEQDCFCLGCCYSNITIQFINGTEGPCYYNLILPNGLIVYSQLTPNHAGFYITADAHADIIRYILTRLLRIKQKQKNKNDDNHPSKRARY